MVTAEGVRGGYREWNIMTDKNVNLCQRLQRLGFTKGSQMKLYGEILDFISEPIILADDVVLVDAQEKKTGVTRRVRIPLPVVHMANGTRSAA
jgi:hypothetical protein